MSAQHTKQKAVYTTAALSANALYKAFKDDTQSGAFPRLSKATRALEAFERAASLATCVDDRLRMLRAIGIVNVECGKLTMKLGGSDGSVVPDEKDILRGAAHFAAAFQAYSDAIQSVDGSGVEEKWVDGVHERVLGASEEAAAFAVFTRSSVVLREVQLSKMTPSGTGAGTWLAKLLLTAAIAEEIKKEVMRLDEAGEWRACRALLGHLYTPLTTLEELVGKLSGSSSFDRIEELFEEGDGLFEQIDALKYEWGYYTARCDHHMHLSNAEDVLRSVFADEWKDSSLDAAKLSLDMFRFAEVAIREPEWDPEDPKAKPAQSHRCHESAAIAYSRMAFVCERVLFTTVGDVAIDDQANEFELACMKHANIATQASGATFFARDWYQEAMKGVEERRNRRIADEAREAAALELLKAPIREKLAGRLAAMKASMTTREGCTTDNERVLALLKFLYATEPPRRKEGSAVALDATLVAKDAAKLKQAMLAAIGLYDAELAGMRTQFKDAAPVMEWYVLCEEILKRLKPFYARSKDTDFVIPDWVTEDATTAASTDNEADEEEEEEGSWKLASGKLASRCAVYGDERFMVVGRAGRLRSFLERLPKHEQDQLSCKSRPALNSIIHWEDKEANVKKPFARWAFREFETLWKTYHSRLP